MSRADLPAGPESAQRLLGSILRCGVTSGRIVETEFYDQSDAASHTFNGRTDRNWPMFEAAGHLYVYRSYGIHWCANVVVGSAGHGSAVLIRALEPVDGVELMWERRLAARRLTDLCSGPGKLCAALGIDGSHSGVDLFEPASPVRLALKPPVSAAEIASGVRIGISKATDRPWRFALAGHPHVSRPVADTAHK